MSASGANNSIAGGYFEDKRKFVCQKPELKFYLNIFFHYNFNYKLILKINSYF
jgi:hypothetical protein